MGPPPGSFLERRARSNPFGWYNSWSQRQERTRRLEQRTYQLSFDGNRSRVPELCALSHLASSQSPKLICCNVQFMINGPNSATGAGSLIIILEKEVDYLVEVSGVSHCAATFGNVSMTDSFHLARTGPRQDSEGEHQSNVGQARCCRRLHGLRDGELLLGSPAAELSEVDAGA